MAYSLRYRPARSPKGNAMMPAPTVIMRVPHRSGKTPNLSLLGAHSVVPKNSSGETFWKKWKDSESSTTKIPSVVTTEISAQLKQRSRIKPSTKRRGRLVPEMLDPTSIESLL